MAVQSKHIIRTQSYEIQLEKEQGAFEFQTRVSNINQLRIAPLLTKILDQFDQDDSLIEFSKIELDLGEIPKENFEIEMQYRIEEKLTYFLQQNIENSERRELIKVSDLPQSKLDKLVFYLLNGYFNWNVRQNELPEKWLFEVMDEYPEQSRKELISVAKSPDVRKRLIYQFQDPVLEKLTQFIDVSNGAYIVDFKKQLLERQEKQKLLSLTNQDLRNSVWEVILEFLFIQTAGYSNRKSLIKHLLEKIAQRQRITFSTFLSVILQAMDGLPLNLENEAEIFKIFKELDRENALQQTNSNVKNLEEAVLEEKLLYFFTHGSLPYGAEGSIESYINLFIKNSSSQARVFFRNLIKNKPRSIEIMIDLLSNSYLLELIELVEIESLRKLNYFYKTIFENPAEAHYLPESLVKSIRARKGELLLVSYLQLNGSTKQMLFSLLMTAKLVSKASNHDFVPLLLALKQILPVSFGGELDQLRQFIVIPAKEDPSSVVNSIKEANFIEKPEIFSADPSKSALVALQQILTEWHEFTETTSDIHLLSEYLWKLLSEYSIKNKLNIQQIYRQAQDLLLSLFPEENQGWQVILDQIDRKINNDFQVIILKEWKDGLNRMLEFVINLLKYSFDGLESADEFVQLLERQSKEYGTNKLNLFKAFQEKVNAEPIIEFERIKIFLVEIENRIFDQHIIPILSNSAQMNVLESKHHQLRKIVYDLDTLLRSEADLKRFDARLFDVIVALSKQFNLSKLAVVEQLQNTLSWSMPEGNLPLEEQLQQSENLLRQQVKSSRYTADLMHYYLEEKALPWWAANLKYNDLKRHASLYVSLFPKDAEQLGKQGVKARNLFELLDLQAQNRMIQAVWQQIPRKFRYFHQQLQELIIQKYGGVRVSFDQLIKTWHYQLWRELVKKKKNLDLTQFSEFYVQIIHKELGIEAEELLQLISFQQSHPYFEREPVKNILKRVFSNQSQQSKPNFDAESFGFNSKSLIPITKGNSLKEILNQNEIVDQIEEEEFMFRLKALIEHSPDAFLQQLQQDELRSQLINLLSDKNREKLAFLGLISEKRQELEQSLEITSHFKSLMTSTQYQKFMSSFYELYFLKLGVDKANSWKQKDWAWLIYQSLRKTFRLEKVDQLIQQVGVSSKIPSAHVKTWKLFEILNTHTLVKKVPIKKASEIIFPETQEQSQSINEQHEIFIQYAGLIIIGPYIPKLFEMLGLTKSGEFHDEKAREHAAYILHHLVSDKDLPTESSLVLPKILCGLEINFPIGPPKKIKKEHKEIIEDLLLAVIEQWKALKKTSIAGLRESFLCREGKLTVHEKEYRLKVTQSSIDILLDYIPWGISKLKLSWMTKILNIEWR